MIVDCKDQLYQQASKTGRPPTEDKYDCRVKTALGLKSSIFPGHSNGDIAIQAGLEWH